MFVKIGLSGLPSIGKTTTLLKTINILESQGYKIGGIVTEEVVEDGKRVGFYLLDWTTKEKKIFAHKDFQSRYKVGKYGLDIKLLEDLGIRALEEAKEADVIVIDELGKMESESKKFVSAVKEILDMDKNIIITVHKKSRNSLLQEIRRRDDIRILEVTQVNRNVLPFKIVSLVKGERV
ncbi:MAG: NTPase [Thermoplasmata archaeon]